MSVQTTNDSLISASEGSFPRRVIVATAIGNGMEWYDFALYGYLATYLASAFFPSSTPISGFLNVMLIFGIAFVFRPLGGWILGPIGDRKGRQFALVLTLGIMAAATVGVGLLPTEASIGIAAPICLVALRCIQGFSAGGEQGPAITFLSEHAPSGRRGFSASFIQSSSIAGFLLAVAIVTTLTTILSPDDMKAWGWRIPFLLALPLGLIGLFIRYGLDETPEFAELKKSGKITESPIATAFKNDWRAMLRIGGIVALQQAGYYTVFVYFSGHLQRMGYTPSQATTAAMISLALAMFLVPAMGALSDRVGRKPVLLGGGTALLLGTIPIFAALPSIGYAGAVVCQLLMTVAVAAYNGVVNATYAEDLGAQTRSGALSIGFNMGTLVFGSPALYVMTLINTTIAAAWAPGVYVAGAAVISLIAVSTLSTRRPAER